MSTPNTYRINVDIKKKMTSVVPKFRQGDTARLIFKVFDNGRSVDLRRYNRAELYHTLPSGQSVVGSCIVTNSEVTYNYISPEMAEVGIVQTMLVLYSDEHIISVRPFGVFIYDSMKKESLSYISVLQELISEVQGQKITVTDLSQQVRELLNEVNIEFDKLLNLENEDQRKANEDERIDAENARIQNESNRQSSFTNMQGYVNNIKGVREYSSTTQYYANNIITYNGSSFIALKNNIDQSPPTLPVKVNEFWQLLAQRGVDGSGAVASVNGILPEINGNIDLSNALVSKGVFDSHSLNIDEDKHIKSVDTLPTDLSDIGFIVKSDEGTVSVPNMTVGDLLEQHVHTYEDDLTTINTNINRKADQTYVNSQVNNITQQLAQISVNVKSFGAIGDGNNDDTLAIQSAIDFVIANNYFSVFLPTGTYKITSSLLIPVKVRITGAGMLNTTIIAANNTFDAISVSPAMRGFEIEHLTIRCNSPIGLDNAGIRFDATNSGYEMRIFNVNIFTFKFGIHAGERFWNNTLENVRINRCETNLYINSIGSNSILNLFLRVYLNEATKENVYMYGTKTSNFISCNFGGGENTERFGTFYNCRNVRLDNCNFEKLNLAQNEGVFVLRGYTDLIVNSSTFLTIGLKDSVTRGYLIYTRENSKCTVDSCYVGDIASGVWDFYVINTSEVLVINPGNMNLQKNVVTTAKFYDLKNVLTNYVSKEASKIIYNMNYEAQNIIEGYSFGGAAIREKQDSFLTIKIDGFAGQSAYVTESRVPLIEPKKIFIEWEKISSSTGDESYLVVADSRNDGYTANVIQSLKKDGAFGRTVSMLNLDNVNSSYYIRVHNRSITASGACELRVYKIWTE